jgi:hypothetical protein
VIGVDLAPAGADGYRLKVSQRFAAILPALTLVLTFIVDAPF